LNDCVPPYNFPKITRKGKKEISNELKEYLQNRGSKGSLNVHPDLWPELIQNVKKNVVYKPCEQSQGADLLIFFEETMLSIQCKNVKNFAAGELVVEIEKISYASPITISDPSSTSNSPAQTSNYKITMILISKTLGSELIEQLEKKKKKKNDDAYYLGPGTQLTYEKKENVQKENVQIENVQIEKPKKKKQKIETKTETETETETKTETKQKIFTIPANMEVYILTESGVRHFISSRSFDNLDI